ncbi:PLAT domain-containing protein 3-like [Silene latifolia]|uniref:PLAT domain-containing protein 3-like n=1 Tax=Silene latifolia TaxID=37657 RepID=UPI003D7759E6
MKIALLNIFILLSSSLIFVAPSEARDESNCVYTIYVKTGSIIKAGTDSKITLELYNKKGDGVRITDIENWGGLMGQNYDYFERSNLDVFSGRGPCLDEPVCAIKLISDGSGPHHGWYVNYIDITTTGPHLGCAKVKFDVEQWLASDAPPYELSAIRDYCPRDGLNVEGGTRSIQEVPSLKSISTI